MGLRFSRRRRLSRILEKMFEMRQNVKRLSTSNVIAGIDKMKIQLDAIKETMKNPGYEDQTS
jgi:hypothetical protein